MRELGFMAASTAVRLVFGLATFGVMARLLGADGFGRFATALAGAVIAGLVVNHGFANHALREIGASRSPEHARRVMAEVLTARLLLAAALLLPLALLATLLPAPWPAIVLAVLAAQAFDAVTDLFNVGLRAMRRYADETRVAVVGAVLQFGLVAAVLVAWPTPEAAAAAFAGARALVMLLTAYGQRGLFPGLRPASIAAGLQRLRQARAFAVDHGLQSLFGQVDSLVLAAAFGPAAVGLYQAGMRVFMGGAQAASVLGNVVIPRLARLKAEQQPTAAAARRAQLAFAITGVVGGAAFAAVPASAVVALLGEDYRGLAAWLPLFGLLFLARMVAAGWGVLLTVHGRQARRATWTAVHWAVVAAGAALLMPMAGVPGWLLALVVGHGVLLAGYGWELARARLEPLAPAPAVASALSGLAIGWIAWQRA